MYAEYTVWARLTRPSGCRYRSGWLMYKDLLRSSRSERDLDDADPVVDGAAWTDGAVDRPAVALTRVVALARAGLAGCDAASLTLMRNGRAIPVASTSDVARELDSIQCRTGEGPCLDAIRQLQVFKVNTATDARSWPVFSRAARSRGIVSSLSVPLTLGGEAVGALNFYARGLGVFDGCEAGAVVFAAQAAATVSGALPVMTPGPTGLPGSADPA